jgi:hypothetical protein
MQSNNEFQYEFDSTVYSSNMTGPLPPGHPSYIITTTNGTAPLNTFRETYSPDLSVSGDAHFDGDIIWKGKNLGEMMTRIEDRLAILLHPDPEKLKQFEALKKAYDHYKIIEALCVEENDDKSRK